MIVEPVPDELHYLRWAYRVVPPETEREGNLLRSLQRRYTQISGLPVPPQYLAA